LVPVVVVQLVAVNAVKLRPKLIGRVTREFCHRRGNGFEHFLKHVIDGRMPGGTEDKRAAGAAR